MIVIIVIIVVCYIYERVECIVSTNTTNEFREYLSVSYNSSVILSLSPCLLLLDCDSCVSNLNCLWIGQHGSLVFKSSPSGSPIRSFASDDFVYCVPGVLIPNLLTFDWISTDIPDSQGNSTFIHANVPLTEFVCLFCFVKSLFLFIGGFVAVLLVLCCLVILAVVCCCVCCRICKIIKDKKDENGAIKMESNIRNLEF